MKAIIFALCAVLALSAVFPGASAQHHPVAQYHFRRRDGKFETAPDTALIQFNISAQADNAKDAYEQALQTSRSHAPGSALEQHRPQVGAKSASSP